MGSTSYITDVLGTPVQYIEYLPFGEVMVEQSTNNILENVYKFNAKELDTQTGYYYYGARYYDPGASIFLSVDPLAEKMPNYNPYAYTFNNPINFTDPTGMVPEGGEWIPGTDGKKIDFKIDDKTQKPIWTSNTSEEFKEVANTMLETKIGSENLREALDSKVKMSVEFSDESRVEGGSAEFGENIPLKLSKDGKTILESKIIIYKGTTDYLNSNYGSDWTIENPDTGGVMHSGKLSKIQNMAGTLGHEFMHTLDKKSSNALSPDSKVEERERRPRQFSEMFHFQISNKK
ncbi:MULTISPECIES: RHS repeat-associated core domain-containing protein [unclassified Myroides]|uniref:RHS repeat domain-containing protein n=1 Tax=unclassified Myroides TaxID=2642485 RepID=UPI002578CB49|nr:MULTISPECIES: RHS repeat-associated core domain-containing protein [unclassified Myroides]